MFKYLLKHLRECITIRAQIVIGVLLIVNASVYALVLLRILGVLLIIRGTIRIVHYIQEDPQKASEGEECATGLLAISLGLLCIFGQNWMTGAFPALAVVYGLFQVLLSFQNIQKTLDSLRLNKKQWYYPGICALLYLIFGLIISLRPAMKPVWVVTGIAMILEGIMEAVTLWMMREE